LLISSFLPFDFSSFVLSFSSSFLSFISLLFLLFFFL
jgi:hypothetical protein